MSSPRQATARPGAPSPDRDQRRDLARRRRRAARRASADVMASSPSGDEAQQPAARADRRQQPLGRMADEQEDGVGRRLLEILEQGVGGVALEIVDRVDHHRAPGRHRGGGREQALQAADLVDVDRAGELGAAFLAPAAPAASDRDGCRRRPAARSDGRRGRRGRARRAGGPARSASTRSAALSANSALPTPSGPASSQAWWSRPASSAARNAATAASWPWSGVTADPRARRAGARSPPPACPPHRRRG